MIEPQSKPHYRNRILLRLTDDDRNVLEPHLERVVLKFRERVERAHQVITDVYFIERGLGSVFAISKNRQLQSEVGMIGSEGMTGFAVLLGVDRPTQDTVMQVEGAAQRISVAALRAVMDEHPSLRRALLSYAYCFAIQAIHTANANAQGSIAQRLARWLLMADDRSDDHELHLTHEILSVMLGVRRAGITTAIQSLETENIVRTSRGNIAILDREGLETLAGGLYGIPEGEYARMFGPARSQRRHNISQEH